MSDDIMYRGKTVLLMEIDNDVIVGNLVLSSIYLSLIRSMAQFYLMYVCTVCLDLFNSMLFTIKIKYYYYN